MGSDRGIRLLTTVGFALVLAAGLAVFVAGWSPEEAEAQGTAAPPAVPVEQRLSPAEARILDQIERA